MLPIFCTAGIGGPNTYFSNMRVPIDNESLMFFRLRWSYDPIPPQELAEYRDGDYYYPRLIPGTFITEDNVHNDYNIDRSRQRDFNYTGIKTFPLQDIAMMENQWGPLAKREREHLVAMDYHMIYLRRKLIAAAKAMRDGIEPQEPFITQAYHYHSASAVIKNGDVEAAIEEAKAKAKVSLRSPEAQKILAV
jgi:hypothetical protein